MTRDDIIRMAKEAGFYVCEEGGYQWLSDTDNLDPLERFANIMFEAGSASRDAEIAEYKQDAERYRWLREDERLCVDEKCADGSWEPVHYEQLDKALDRARGEGK